MNCVTFRKKLNDYMEGCMSYDLKDAMEKHLKECKCCSDIYAEELFVDNAMKKSIESNNVVFSSITADVMKNIDRSRYEKRVGNKALLYIRDHIPMCATIAAVITISIIIAPTYSKKNAEVSFRPASLTNEETFPLKTDQPTSEDPQTDKKQNIYAPEIIRSAIAIVPDTTAEWKNSVNNKYAAAVVGTEKEGKEEQISAIVVKGIANKEKWYFEVDKKSNKRSNTPKVVEWWDDENLLVVFGYAYGNITSGGDLYILNINSGRFIPAYEIDDEKSQIIDVVKTDNDLQLSVQVYDDREWRSYHKEKWSIASFDISLGNKMQVINSSGIKISDIGGIK